jgi:hypothetical protein
MKRTSLIYLMVLSAGVWTGTNALAQEDNPRARDVIYGYAPGELTQDNDTDIATTAEEEGHYVEGFADSQPEERVADPVRREQVPVSGSNPAGVLISAPRPQRTVDEPRPRTEANRRSAQVNDSQNLDREIEQHRWTVPF